MNTKRHDFFLKNLLINNRKKIQGDRLNKKSWFIIKFHVSNIEKSRWWFIIKHITSYIQEKNHHSFCQINISWVCMISKHGFKSSTYNMHKFKNWKEKGRIQRYKDFNHLINKWRIKSWIQNSMNHFDKSPFK